MSHLVDSLKIQNYKSCKDITVSLANFTPVVGYNNAGKSNILSALNWLLKPKVIQDTGYFDKDQPIIVEGTFAGVTESVISELAEEHQDPIRPFVSEKGRMRIVRTQKVGAKKASDITIEMFNFEEGKLKKNPRGLWNAIKALFPEPIEIRAMENAADDASNAKSTSTIGKLLKEIATQVNNQNTAAISRHLNAVSRRISADGDRRSNEIQVLDKEISNKLDSFFPGIDVKLHFEVPDFDELVQSGTIKLYEHNIGRNVNEYGHGTQRSVQMALIQQLSEVMKGAESATTTLLLIDEPELYLHPFAIEQVREALTVLSKRGYQIIFTTHSAQMVEFEVIQNALLVRKNAHSGTNVRNTLRQALKTVLPNKIDAQIAHLFELSQSSKVLFANEVVLTEGKTEVRLLPYLYKSLKNKTLGQDNYALIQTGSVDNIDKTMQILNAMDIPSKSIVDLDYVFKGAIHNKQISDTDTDYVALKSILEHMVSTGEIILSGALPKAEHCAKIALNPDSKEIIKRLHDKLLAHNIWLWKKGAIEAHLGLTQKNEQAWANFKQQLESQSNNIDAICPDENEIEELLDWIN
ncbi:ATP-dependent nuclease [Vibrio sp. DNB22_10_4]